MSDDAVLDGTDMLLAPLGLEFSVEIGPPGSQYPFYSVSGGFTVPAAAPGARYLLLFVDAAAGVREFHVIGVLSCALLVLTAPDFVPRQLTFTPAAGAAAGAFVSFSYRSEERRVGKECASRGWLDRL